MLYEVITLSGYQGVAVWFLPIPIANYGMRTMFYRTCELVGTKFTSVWKAMLLLYPLVIVCIVVFSNFIGIDLVPEDTFPLQEFRAEYPAGIEGEFFGEKVHMLAGANVIKASALIAPLGANPKISP